MLINNMESSRHIQEMIDFAKVVINGLAKLVECQREFAHEYGLGIEKVFPDSFNVLIGNRVKDIVTLLFEKGSKNTLEMKLLFNDLIAHQIALNSGLNGIAEEGLIQLNPKIIQSDSLSTVTDKRDAHSWRIFIMYYGEIYKNSNSRIDKIISSGLIKKYIHKTK